MAKAVELPFFILGEALYGRASETERELFIGGYCMYGPLVAIEEDDTGFAPTTEVDPSRPIFLDAASQPVVLTSSSL